MTYLPTLATERQATGHWTRCLESSFSMLSDKLTLGASIVDSVKLSAVIPGSANGSDVAGNLAAIAKVYPSFPVTAIHKNADASVIWPLLLAGNGIAVNGYYDRIKGVIGDFTRWDRTFAAGLNAGHAAYIQIDGPAGETHVKLKELWWMDPLAPAGFAGQWMPLSTLLLFLAKRNENAYAHEGVPASKPVPAPAPPNAVPLTPAQVLKAHVAHLAHVAHEAAKRHALHVLHMLHIGRK